MTLVLAGQGRPLRAASTLALLLGCWGMWRLPILQGELAALGGRLVQAGVRVIASPPRPSGGQGRRPGTHFAGCGLGLSRPVPGTMIAVVQPRPPDLAVAVLPLSLQPARPPLSVPVVLPPPAMPPLPIVVASVIGAESAPVAGALAAQAYARLAAGDRRRAARLFDAALAAGPDARAGQWRAERRRLGRRWSGGVFSLLRDAGDAGNSGIAGAATPVLGGGQTGATLAFAIDPLARRPVALVARVNAAIGAGAALDRRSAQGAIGVRWQLLPQASLSAERLIALGADARDDWVVRLAAGGAARHGRIEVTGYGEAGVIANGDVFAGAQGRAVGRALVGPVALSAGAGGWASVQAAGTTTARVDVGPTLAASLPLGTATLEVSADWRFRVAGNAAPGSGPVVTLSTRF